MTEIMPPHLRRHDREVQNEYCRHRCHRRHLTFRTAAVCLASLLAYYNWKFPMHGVDSTIRSLDSSDPEIHPLYSINGDNQIGQRREVGESSEVSTNVVESDTDDAEKHDVSDRERSGPLLPKAEQPSQSKLAEDKERQEGAKLKQGYWEFQISDQGILDCKIHTTPIASNINNETAPMTEYKYTADNQKEQYIIHIHGLHHTGTGYLRKTLHDALNEEFSTDENNIKSYPVASIQDCMRPYQHQIEEAKNENNVSKLKELNKQHYVSENEGQHLQTVFPTFFSRTQLKLKLWKMTMNARLKFLSKISYLADVCTIPNKDDSGVPSDTNNKRVGTILLQQWMRYWDSSATFLLQKTPTLDVLFLERVKVLPTLHVIIVRHPMTSSSWGYPSMAWHWINAWSHVLETLQQGEIEWYAVVTYEALISNHDAVVQELLEVVRSGMRRYHSKGRVSKRTASDAQRSRTKNANQSSRPRRRLRLHEEDKSNREVSTSYLAPKEQSVSLWETCLRIPNCDTLLRQVTINIFPYLGYASVRNQKLRPLSPSPGTVTVSQEFGHVLYSSEGVALNKLRQSRKGIDNQIDYEPPLKLISKMKEICENSSNSSDWILTKRPTR